MSTDTTAKPDTADGRYFGRPAGSRRRTASAGTLHLPHSLSCVHRLAGTVGLALLLSSLLAAQCRPDADRVTLTVHVVSLLDGAPVTGATVEVMSLDTTAASSARAFARKLVDKGGSAKFDLPRGRYRIRMASGYTGQAEMDLREPAELQLQVLRVPQGKGPAFKEVCRISP